ncbi:MAG: hypothetical protein E7632_01725 [Ruminococcaceae bacterium]|nr:hypothetical protein [Oscillospiraceae bacterium]
MRKFSVCVSVLALLLVLICSVSCGEEEIPMLNVTSEGTTDFWVIRSDYSKDFITSLSVKLRRSIRDATGVEPGITTDWDKNPVYEHEIIVGETLREENIDFVIDRVELGETGYIIKESNGKIYIAGGTHAGTELAVNYFINNFVKAGEDVRIPVGYERIVYHEFDISELYVNMNLVEEDWTIVIPADANNQIKDAAARMQAAIVEKCGMELAIVTGDASAHRAFILSSGKPEIDGVHSMRVDGDRFIMESSAKAGVGACADKFVSLYIRDKFGKYNFPADYRFMELGDYMIVKYPD